MAETPDTARRAHTLHRLRLAAVCAVLTAVAFQQDPGQIVGDTKLDLVVDPGKFLARSLSLWDAQGFSGQLQNQAYGYLFPMGPFFWLGHAVGLPAWAIQRAWVAALLCLAFLGVVRLAGALGCGTRTSRVVAGVVFALTPRLMTELGPVSVEALPMCVAPWVLLPLVRGARRGSPRRAALASAATVVLAGGVNAAAAAAVLPLPVLWLLTRGAGPRKRRLAVWWTGGVVLATFWWLGPLLLLGRYSPPFLDYIEDADVTTRFTSLVEVLRGASQWVAFLDGPNGPSWRAGWYLVSQPLLIAMSVLLVAVGLAGLARRTMPHRGFLLLGLGAGLAMVTFGHLAGVDGVLATWQHGLLDGVLAPVRNVHKYDVVLRLPLVLGLAHVLGTMRFGVGAAEVRRTRTLATAAVAGIAVLGTGAPLLLGRLEPAGSAGEIPGYWRDAARYLGTQQHADRTVLLPGSRFGTYLWGSLGDEPLQSLARSPWTVRNSVPLTQPGYVRVLDRVEQAVASGRPDPSLGEYLARAGLTRVLVRNDLDWRKVGAPRPAMVHATLVSSGFVRVASFGPKVGGTAAQSPLVVDGGADPTLPALEVYQLDGVRPTPGSPAATGVRTTPLSDVPVVVGGPEALDTAPADDGGVSVLASDAGPGLPGLTGPTVLTDTLRRREVGVGRNEGNGSATLTADAPYVLGQPRHDYLPTEDERWLTPVDLTGLTSVTADHSTSDPDSPWPTRPENQPYAAVDGDPLTAWSAWDGLGGNPTLHLTLSTPLDTGRLRLTPYLVTGGSHVTAVRVTTDTGALTSVVNGFGPWTVDVPPGPTSHLSIELVSDGAGRFEQLGLREVELPSTSVRRVLELPSAPAGRAVDAVVVQAAEGARSGCVTQADGTRCAPSLERAGEDDSYLAASFELPQTRDLRLSVQARARPGPRLDQVLEQARPDGVRVRGSSAALLDPRAGAGAAYDDDDGTAWLASPDDPQPVLTLRWPVAHRLTGITVSQAGDASGRRPTSVEVDTGAGYRPMALDGQGHGTFPAATTRRVQVRFGSLDQRTSVDAERLAVSRTGIAVPEVRLTGAPVPDAGTEQDAVRLGCGQGPTVTVDGHAYRTKVTTTRGVLLDQAPFDATVCGSASSSLGAGRHLLVADGQGRFVASRTVLARTAVTTPAPDAAVAPSAFRAQSGAAPRVLRWDATTRRVQLPQHDDALLLSVDENANAGWQATLGGRTLQPLRVDGWAQGWVVPAGAAGTVHLDFTPQRPYLLTLLLGGLGVLVCLVGALVPARAGARAVRLPATGTARRRLLVVGALTTVVALALGGVVAVVVTAAVTAVIAAARWLLSARPAASSALVVVPAALTTVAGLLLAARPFGGLRGYVGDDAALQVLCVAALAAVVACYALDAGRRRRYGAARSDVASPATAGDGGDGSDGDGLDADLDQRRSSLRRDHRMSGTSSHR